MMKLFFLVGVLVLLLSSCDPARRIVLSNTTNDTTEFVWKVPKDSLGFNPFVIANSRELKFVMMPHQKSISMSFGVGTWDDAYLKSFVRYLEEIEIKQQGKKTVHLTEPEAIYSFLRTHRQGKSKTKIVVEAKD